MAGKESDPKGSAGVAASSDQAPTGWPLSFQLKIPNPQGNTIPRRVWNHFLYRDPKNQTPRILYSKSKAESEQLAREFLKEPIVGFDMEWPWDSDKRSRLQDKVGLIQIASENKIALFHIGLHKGATTQDLIAPSLRQVIESDNIIKTGVGIMNADFSRLDRYFGLKPRAAFELSHLHRLVTFGAQQPDMVTTKLWALAKQVEEHLGLPLFKGKVRTSDWSKPLSRQQITYAADDAYAGLMLFHCMNAKRLAMNPVPPLPVLADRYGDGNLPLAGVSVRALLLQPQDKDGEIIVAKQFLTRASDGEDAQAHKAAHGKEPMNTKTTGQTLDYKPSDEAPANAQKDDESIAGLDKGLYQRLAQLRGELAKDESMPAYIIAHNTVLEDIARQRPLNIHELSQIKGIGQRKIQQYGPRIVGVVAQFVAERDVELSQPRTPSRGSKRRAMGTTAAGKEPCASPQLHTGLSFSLEQTTVAASRHPEDDSDSDPSAFGSPMKTPTTSQLKRRRMQDMPRAVSPTKAERPREPFASDFQRSISASSQLPRAPNASSSQAPAPTQSQRPPETLNPSALVFQKKLIAFSRMVTSKLQTKPQTPILSEAVAELIATQPPHTGQELLKIPGIVPLVRACAEAQVNLLDTILKWTPVPASNPG
ncbi:hypothetical protein BJ170DRAFT_682897 [Xylariales sp. AK1849]|nr:hypothetical protein BJ170DRAFT_682897 [Xylariales sp. AK1849]